MVDGMARGEGNQAEGGIQQPLYPGDLMLGV